MPTSASPTGCDLRTFPKLSSQVKVPTVVYKDRDVRVYKAKEIIEKIVEVEKEVSSGRRRALEQSEAARLPSSHLSRWTHLFEICDDET